MVFAVNTGLLTRYGLRLQIDVTGLRRHWQSVRCALPSLGKRFILVLTFSSFTYVTDRRSSQHIHLYLLLLPHGSTCVAWKLIKHESSLTATFAVYANSLMAILNARKRIRGDDNGDLATSLGDVSVSLRGMKRNNANLTSDTTVCVNHSHPVTAVLTMCFRASRQRVVFPSKSIQFKRASEIMT